MSTDRVTVSLPADIREAAQRLAREAGLPFSAAVTEALSSWVRGRLVDSWLLEYQSEHGAFDEDELRQIAAEAGTPYIPPSRSRTVA
jgi:hypothetical protein